MLAILAQQNQVIRDLTTNADTVITALANNRADVGRWVVAARKTAPGVGRAATPTWPPPSRSSPASSSELRPTMAALGAWPTSRRRRCATSTPAAGQLTRFFTRPRAVRRTRRGPSFRSPRPGLPGRRPGGRSRPTTGTIRLLKTLRRADARAGQEPGDHPRRTSTTRARAVEKDPRAAKATGRPAPTGYTGLEALLQYVFDQEQAINVFDSQRLHPQDRGLRRRVRAVPQRRHGEQPEPGQQPGAPDRAAAAQGLRRPPRAHAAGHQRAGPDRARHGVLGARALDRGRARPARRTATPPPRRRRARPPRRTRARAARASRSCRSTSSGRSTSCSATCPTCRRCPASPPQLPPSVTNPTNNAGRSSKQDAQALLDYLLAP